MRYEVGMAKAYQNLAELTAFVTRHRPCGQLSGAATEPAPDGYMLGVVCSCGVVFLRWVTREAGARPRPSDARH